VGQNFSAEIIGLDLLEKEAGEKKDIITKKINNSTDPAKLRPIGHSCHSNKANH